MEITIIGSGTCVPSERRASPCVLVKAGGATILCDTGPGTLRQLLRAGVSMSTVDMLIYTHFHIDHTADFCPFLFTSKYGKELERTRDLIVMGPPGLQKWYDSLIAAHGTWIRPEKFSIQWFETTGGTHCFSGFTVQSAQVLHSDASIAVRIQEDSGPCMAYSGDTDFCGGIIDISRCVDKAILECSCPEESKVAGHLTPSLAGRIAREAGCKSLVLTHIYPEADRHDLLTPLRREYSGPAEIAHDLMTFKL